MTTNHDGQEFDDVEVAGFDDWIEQVINDDTCQPESPAQRAPATNMNNRKDGDGENMQMWAKMGSSYMPCTEAVEQLPAGQFVIIQGSDGSITFQKSATEFDDIIQLSGGSTESVMEKIEDFWTKEHLFRQYGYLWKRGILLYGPPGSGKTSLLQLVSQKLIKNGGLAIYVIHPAVTAQGLKLLREVEPTRPLVVMLEDIDAIIENYGEAHVLALLDGELQVDNVVFIATTNYPEKLDGRLKNRPSRFDIVEYVGMPNEESRRGYITHTMNKAGAENDYDIDLWVDKTEDLSLAHIKELLILVQIFSVPFDEALERIMVLINKEPCSDDFQTKNKRNRIGFNVFPDKG